MHDLTADTSTSPSTEPAAAPASAPEEPTAAPAAEAAAAPAAPTRPRTKAPRRSRPSAGRRQKEAFWVRVAFDGSSQFFPATDYIGKKMPFSNPKETCAMRVYEDVVCFSLLHLTKRAAKDLREKPIEVPHAPLSRLARRSAEVPVTPGTVIVEHRTEVDGEQVDRSVTMSLQVSESRVATLESDDPVAEEPFELGGRGERISLFLSSPTVPRRVALGFIGHLGKPGSADTLARCAAKILHAAAALPEFSLLTGIEAADVPALPGGVTVVRPVATRAEIDIPVRLFTEAMPPAMVGSGTMRVEVDLEHANAATDRLLYTITPDDAIAEVFDTYREVADRWLTGRLAELLGEEIRMIIFDIVLGEVTEETVERINEKLAVIGGVDFTPTKFRNTEP